MASPNVSRAITPYGIQIPLGKTIEPNFVATISTEMLIWRELHSASNMPNDPGRICLVANENRYGIHARRHSSRSRSYYVMICHKANSLIKRSEAQIRAQFNAIPRGC